MDGVTMRQNKEADYCESSWGEHAWGETWWDLHVSDDSSLKRCGSEMLGLGCGGLINAGLTDLFRVVCLKLAVVRPRHWANETQGITR
jgi:hypothetical protein